MLPESHHDTGKCGDLLIIKVRPDGLLSCRFPGLLLPVPQVGIKILKIVGEG